MAPSHPRASAFGLSLGLGSPGPLGRFCQVLLHALPDARRVRGRLALKADLLQRDDVLASRRRVVHCQRPAVTRLLARQAASRASCISGDRSTRLPPGGLDRTDWMSLQRPSGAITPPWDRRRARQRSQGSLRSYGPVRPGIDAWAGRCLISFPKALAVLCSGVICAHLPTTDLQ